MAQACIRAAHLQAVARVCGFTCSIAEEKVQWPEEIDDFSRVACQLVSKQYKVRESGIAMRLGKLGQKETTPIEQGKSPEQLEQPTQQGLRQQEQQSQQEEQQPSSASPPTAEVKETFKAGAVIIVSRFKSEDVSPLAHGRDCRNPPI